MKFTVKSNILIGEFLNRSSYFSQTIYLSNQWRTSSVEISFCEIKKNKLVFLNQNKNAEIWKLLQIRNPNCSAKATLKKHFVWF